MAATKLHEGMITCDDLIAENNMEALSRLVNETEWYVVFGSTLHYTWKLFSRPNIFVFVSDIIAGGNRNEALL